MPNFDTLTLKIRLGNATMQTHEDIAQALTEAPQLLVAGWVAYDGTIRDLNGNRVGQWAFTDEDYTP